MNPNSPVTIYGMVGPMGSGKTTLALKIATEQGALFQTLDGTIQSFNEPIEDLDGYESLMPKAMDVMFSKALQALRGGQSVVFDVGRLTWLMELAEAADAKIQVYHFNIPAEERWRRVQKRNTEKPENVYHWTMDKESFDAQHPHHEVPPSRPGLTIVKITE